MSQKRVFEPITPILLVSRRIVTTLPPDRISAAFVGEKAYGLSCIPDAWTLPFFAISSDFIRECHEANNRTVCKIIQNWLPQISKAATHLNFLPNDFIIVRSSALNESIENRGKYYSQKGNLSDISTVLFECTTKVAKDKELDAHNLPLVIQKYAVPVSAKGHLSNERRFYKEKRDWIGEFEDSKKGAGKPFKINLRNWRKRVPVENEKNKGLLCNLSVQIPEKLKIPAAWGYEAGVRVHYEWVWDGQSVFLVQADRAQPVQGVNPTKPSFIHQNIAETFHPKCLVKINKQHASKYHKIRNVFTYIQLGLPTTDIYVLEDQSIIKDLSKNSISSNLKSDIEHLVKGSLVIRMDIDTSDQGKRQLLPRTQEVREVDEAIDWLRKNSLLSKSNNMGHDTIFIFHNFIPALSSVFAYASPKERKVQIESLWGLPEGLYYNSHDKYIVDTKSSDLTKIEDVEGFSVKVKCNYKHYFVSPDEKGKWETKILNEPFDWGATIKNHDIVKNIAYHSRRISDKENLPLSVMWFVDVHGNKEKGDFFPWFHEKYDLNIAKSDSVRRKTPFDEALTIRTSEDINKLKNEADRGSSSVTLIKIQPMEEFLLRDKMTLRTIGELAKKISAIILLEGGVLSHAYYQLVETKATVEVIHPFNNDDEVQEFYKLVRDKIPEKIINSGEFVRKTNISGDYLLRALKEKLIEESFECLDASDTESIIGELADVCEVVDSIVELLDFQKKELLDRQAQKRQKSGGFKDGAILLETKNPLPASIQNESIAKLFTEDNSNQNVKLDNITISELELSELAHRVKQWEDKRDHPPAQEKILNIVVPSIRDNWVAEIPVKNIDPLERTKISVKLTGARNGAKNEIELSVFTKPLKPKPRQLLLFGEEENKQFRG